MKLLDGLKEGLHKIKHEMTADEVFFARQETLISSALLPLIEQHSARQQQQKELEAAAEELANCDQDQLSHARQSLLSIGADVEDKKHLLESLQRQMQENEERIKAATEAKQSCLEAIKEAEKIREEHRGWTATEVGALKGEGQTSYEWPLLPLALTFQSTQPRWIC
jgi:kinetochore protein Spc7/SPC105